MIEISNIDKEFDSKPVYNKIYLETKIKFHELFYDKKFLR